MNLQTRSNWRNIFQLGLIGAAITLSISAVGLVETFDGRDVIGEVVSVGQIFLFGTAIGIGYMTAQRNPGMSNFFKILGGLIVGLISSLPLVLIVLIAEPIDIRRFLISLSPDLIEILTFGQGQMPGLLILVGACSLMGLVGVAVSLIPNRFRRPLIAGLATVFLVGLLSETIILAWGNQGLGLVIRRVIFAARGLSIAGAIVMFALAAGISFFWSARGEGIRQRVSELPPARQQSLRWGSIGLGVVLLLILPFILRTYLTEVMDNVGLYILMGLGLNIVVGFAGLLDLGYVAFYAIGAYTVGVLTSTGELGAGLPFWVALPLAVLAAVAAGVILGIPVLRMRGDYLAIVTLGFGEIIRILALSDALAPFIGGAQGILHIPNISVFGQALNKPEHLYYMILAGCALAFYISWRLRDSRLGRQWMAMREDEDVAEAMGINLVKTKLLAFATGAALSGLSGAILAPKLNTIFPHSFALMVSVNVLCLIIVGGMGSLPGVVVGALVLIGLPELLREFAEYRMLMYGVLLIIMMLARPEGFWPSEVIKRELRADEEAELAEGAATCPVEPE